MERWTNWSGTVTATPTRVDTPRSVAEIVAAVRAATAAGESLRVRGSGHSFTAIAAAAGHAIDLGQFAGIESVDRASGLVRVRAGTTLHRLNRELDDVGLAMTNLGDIDAQTLAGALSTGTHGTGAALGGLATQVDSLDLVLADGSTMHCSAQDDPEVFAAARVGLGALGVLSHVTLRCEPSFVLSATERPEPLDDVISQFTASAAAADHVEFYWFPYGRNALVKRNTRLPADTVPRPLHPAKAFLDYTVTENLVFGAMCRTARAVPALTAPLGALSAAALSSREYSDRSHRVFVSKRSVRFVESEFAVPREHLGRVLAELRELVPTLESPVMFPVEVRVAAADDIWLSTAYGRDTAYVAVHQYIGMPYREYFAGFAAIASAVGGRPHWAKLHDLNAEDLQVRYPRFDDFRRVRKELDAHRLFTNPYLDRVLGSY